MTWLQTYTGKRFDLENPTVDMVTLEDVAHALALQNRFSGHTSRAMSVALHSVLVSEHLPLKHALAGLLHDAHEAYVVDLPRPMKALVPDYCRIERRVQKVVLERFQVWAYEDVHHAAVQPVDYMLACAEAKALLPNGAHLFRQWTDWEEPPACVVDTIKAMTGSQGLADGGYGIFRTALLSLTYGEEPTFRACSCKRPA